MIDIAVIGYGYWGPNLVRNFQETDSARVKLCCDVEESRLNRVKVKYPSIETTTDYDEVLRNKEIAGVAIATPVATHYEFVRRALESGKHVLVEKPLAASVSEAEKLVGIAEKRKLVLMVNHTFIYTGAVRKMKEIIAGGTWVTCITSIRSASTWGCSSAM